VALARQVFNLDFTSWIAEDGWTGRFQPYAAVDGGRVLAAAAANVIDCHLAGIKRRYIQLSTVMTAPDRRHQGCGRLLIQAILHDCQDADGFFLYANDSVLGFYPRFGFRIQPEHHWHRTAAGGQPDGLQPVALPDRAARGAFIANLAQRPSLGAVTFDTPQLTLFHLLNDMRHDAGRWPAADAWILAHDGYVTAIHAPTGVSPRQVADAFAAGTDVELAFAPADADGFFRRGYHEEDSTLFVLGPTLTADMAVIGSFPDVMHT